MTRFELRQLATKLYEAVTEYLPNEQLGADRRRLDRIEEILIEELGEPT